MNYPDNTVAILNDGYSVITVDDGCYVLKNLAGDEWRSVSHIFPEALEVLRGLPDDPRHAPIMKRIVWVVGSQEDFKYFISTSNLQYIRLVKSEQIYGLVNPQIAWLDDWWKHVPNPLDLLQTIMTRTR
jgi:hypothetical protein